MTVDANAHQWKISATTKAMYALEKTSRGSAWRACFVWVVRKLTKTPHNIPE